MLSFTLLLASSFNPLTPVLGDGCSSTSASKTALSAGGEQSSKDLVDTAVSAGSFKTLATALGAAGLVDALKGKGPFTVFAPTDAAFAALPKGTLEELLRPENKERLTKILTYHVVPGLVEAKDVVKLSGATTLNGQRIDVLVSDQGVQVDGARVTKTDIRCTNGIIHVLDAVILPSSKDAVTTLVESGRAPTLVAAVKAAGLVEALQGKGPFTIFVPTEEAFAALPAGTLEKLLKPENKEQLAAILKLHVVPSRVYSDAAAKGASVASLQGGKLETSSRDGQVFVNGARVVRADVDASNAVLHTIDRVLLPE